MKERIIYREAKIEMLKIYWKQVIGWFVGKAIEKGDCKIKDVATDMMKIEKDIQDYVLRRLLSQIQKLVSIATYKNRQIKRPYSCDHEEIEIQIKKFQNILVTDMKTIQDPEWTI